MARKSREETREHEQQAWALRCKGRTCQRIADELGVTRGAVVKMLQRVEQRVLDELKDSVKRVKVVQTSQLEHIVEESMCAWEKSKEDSKVISQRKILGQPEDDGDAGLSTVEETITQQVRGQYGDPAFLTKAMEAQDRIRKIWGLDAPTKVAPTTPDGEEPYAGEFSPEDQVRLVEAVLARLGITDADAAGQRQADPG